MYDFPASPVAGDEYTPPVGGQTYIWQPPRWLVKGIPPAGGGGGGGIGEAPTDGKSYVRKSAAWDDFTDDMAAKLNASAYTAADVLAKLLTVDGAGSNLDADLLDGQTGTYYLDNANTTGTLPAASFNDTTHGVRAGGTLHAAVTTSVNGFMISTDKTKLDGVATSANNYVHPSGDGNLHVPATGTGANGMVLKAGSTAGSGAWATLTKTDVGLANVDNTADTAKPVSTAQQTALNLKADLAGPLFTGDARAVTPATADNDVSIATTAFVRSALTTYGAPATAQSYNRVINGQFFIDTAGTGAVTTNGYFCDQWSSWRSTSAGVMTAVVAAKAVPTALGGAIYCGRLTVNTADATLAATEYMAFSQSFEGSRMADLAWGTAAAKQVIVRFTFKGPAGTYAMAFTSSTEARAYVKSFTISVANTDAVQTFVVPGDTTVGSTWVTTTALWGYFYITLAAGSTLAGTDGAWQTGPKYGVTGQTNGMGTAGAVFEITDVGIYADPSATGVAPQYQPVSYALDEQDCMRYYEFCYGQSLWCGYTATTLGYTTVIHFKVPKRISSAAVSGTHIAASRFPAAVGTLGMLGATACTESRTSNATGDASTYQSTIIVNARL